MTTVRIAPAEPKHAEELTALMQDSAAYRGQYATILHEYQVTAGYLNRHPTFRAEANTSTTTLGFYSLITHPPELDLLFVANEAQGLGIGAKLIEHMLTQAREQGIQSIKVVSHPPSEGFYTRMGARKVGVIPARPPKVTWERPQLVFTIADTQTLTENPAPQTRTQAASRSGTHPDARHQAPAPHPPATPETP
ncbi:GNAT family N-acetyltransferase [Actinosynnema sp. CS-041913]|uniref:GNAT family N-acetyltransferase n=1 Tax=Actinosynnema sp. CS-041913 TaxID=3239917 RepID=UPI003D93C6DC